MPQLSDTHRTFIIEKRQEGNGYRKIKTLFTAKFNRSVCKKTTIKLIKKFEETGSVGNQKRANTRFKFGTEAHKELLDNAIREKPYSTAKELPNLDDI